MYVRSYDLYGQWTPGHRGIDGNENADKIACESVNNPSTRNACPLLTY